MAAHAARIEHEVHCIHERNTLSSEHPHLAALQVATSSKALIFDLLALGSSPGLDACLAPALGSADVVKLGFDVYGDLAKLAASYPDTQVGRGAYVVCGVWCVWLEMCGVALVVECIT